MRTMVNLTDKICPPTPFRPKKQQNNNNEISAHKIPHLPAGNNALVKGDKRVNIYLGDAWSLPPLNLVPN